MIKKNQSYYNTECENFRKFNGHGTSMSVNSLFEPVESKILDVRNSRSDNVIKLEFGCQRSIELDESALLLSIVDGIPEWVRADQIRKKHKVFILYPEIYTSQEKTSQIFLILYAGAKIGKRGVYLPYSDSTAEACKKVRLYIKKKYKIVTKNRNGKIYLWNNEDSKNDEGQKRLKKRFESWISSVDLENFKRKDCSELLRFAIIFGSVISGTKEGRLKLCYEVCRFRDNYGRDSYIDKEDLKHILYVCGIHYKSHKGRIVITGGVSSKYVIENVMNGELVAWDFMHYRISEMCKRDDGKGTIPYTDFLRLKKRCWNAWKSTIIRKDDSEKRKKRNYINSLKFARNQKVQMRYVINLIVKLFGVCLYSEKSLSRGDWIECVNAYSLGPQEDMISVISSSGNLCVGGGFVVKTKYK